MRDGWAEAAAGWPVVVGSRAAAFAPLPRLAGAVVLDAHDEAYREERAPPFDAVEVVAERAASDGAPCLLVSPCPTVVQLAGRDHWVPHRAAERRGWPGVSVVDRRAADPRTGLLSEELVPRLGRRPARAWSSRAQPHRAGPAARLRRLRRAGPLRALRPAP